MANWYLLRGNEILNLSDRNPFDVVSVQNIGVPLVRRLTERGPFQDGDTDIGFRLDARLVNLVLVSVSPTRASADAVRTVLWQWFKPARTPAILRCTKDDGITRQIDVHPVGVIDAPIMEEERIGAFQRYAVQMRASLPVWYDPVPGVYNAIGGASTGSYGFQIPMLINWVMVSSSEIDADLAIPYQGSWPVFPKIILYGPASGVEINNMTTGEILNFPALTLLADQWIEIDLAYGAKTIIDQAGANRIAALSSNSDLATWHLAPDPDAPGGVNEINFTVATSATIAIGIKFEYAQHYIGL